MPYRTPSLGKVNVIGAAAGFTFMLLTASGYAQGSGSGALTRLAGQWAGSGTVDLANGAHEAIKCRASYDVLEEQNNVQLSIRCASDSYNFDMHASATLAANAITGSWNEVSRNVAGKISGKAEGDRIDVDAESSAFSASMALVTRGARQSVVIKSKESDSSVKGATITLQRT